MPRRTPCPVIVSVILLCGGCSSPLTPSQKQACRFDRECIELCQKAQDDQSASEREECYAAMRGLAQEAETTVPARPAGPRPKRAAVATVGRSAGPLTPAEIASRSLPSIVVVKTDTGLGSGFAVGKPQRVVTNLHVVAGAAKIQAFLVDGEPLEVQGLLGWDSVNDLAVLQIEEGLPMLTVAQDAPGVGDPVVAIGNPLGFAATVSNGIVSGFRKEDATTLMQISAPIAPGSSGGPVIDDHGQVVGVAVATLRAGQNMNFAVPAKFVEAALAGGELQSIEAFATATRAAPKAAPKDLPAAPSFKGCTVADKKYLTTTLKEAIDSGAGLCASGKGAACFHIYEGAAQDSEKGISSGCAGPRTALSSARTYAGTLTDPAEKAQLLERTLRSVGIGAANPD